MSDLPINQIICGDVIEQLKTLPDQSIDCCITSPPYWGLRDYGVDGQIGLEKTPEEYVAKMVAVFSEVKRCLKKEGTLWLNLGDSYAMSSMRGKNSLFNGAIDQSKQGIVGINKSIPIGLKPKDLVGIPWRTAFALQADGWYLRQDIIWHKPNPMPESVTDRCTKSHEYIFLMAKSQKYYFENEAIKENSTSDIRQRYRKTGEDQDSEIGTKGNAGNDGFRNKRSVWTITTKPFKEAHFATFPEDLIVPMVKAGCPKDGIVLDPFMGAGTTAVVARKLSRKFIGIELNPKYIQIAEKRMAQEVLF